MVWNETKSRRHTLSRRSLLSQWILGAGLASLALFRLRVARAAQLPLLSPADPAARKLQYTEDARQVKGLAQGNTCATCALYQGTDGSAQGPCQIFPGKAVKAAGWCSSWAPQM